jgi:hypothetical protein
VGAETFSFFSTLLGEVVHLLPTGRQPAEKQQSDAPVRDKLQLRHCCEAQGGWQRLPC